MKKMIVSVFLLLATRTMAEPVVQADTNRILAIATNAIAVQRNDLSVTNLDVSKLTFFSNGKEVHDIFVEFRDRTPIMVPNVDPENHTTTTNVRFKTVIVRMDRDGNVKNVSPPRQTKKLMLSDYLKHKDKDRSTPNSSVRGIPRR